ncbi:MAG TPA: transcriptional regulator [Clostridiales bacterium]|nr:transcriptional regulator [Clostridiales bacterium]
MLRLKDLRKEEGLTQKALAEKIGYAAHNVGDWERGKAEPSISDLIKLADVFGCSVDYLIGRTDDFGNINGFTEFSEEERLFSIVTRNIPKA